MYSNQGYERSGSPGGETRAYKRYRYPGDEEGSDNVFVGGGDTGTQRVPTSRQPDIVNNLNSPPSRPTQDQVKSPGTWNYLTASVDLSPAGHKERGHRGGEDKGVTSPAGYTTHSPYSLNRSQDRRTDSHGVRDSARTQTKPPWDQSRNYRDGEANVNNLSFRARWERNRNAIAQHFRETSDSTGGTNSGSSGNRHQPTTPHRNIMDRSFDVEGVAAPRDPATALSPQSTHSVVSPVAVRPTPNQSLLSAQSVYSPRNPNVSREESVFGSLRRDPVTHRIIPNGSTRPLRDNLSQSRHSINLSRLSLNRIPKITLYGKDYGVYNSLISLGVQALVSLVFCFLGMQLLLRLSQRAAPGLPSSDSILQTNTSYNNVLHVTVAFSSIVVMLNLCCVLTCSLQFFFAAKLVKCPQGEER